MTDARMNRIRNLDIAIAVVIIGIDQWTKWLVVKGMGLYDSISLIPGFLNITHVRNTGAAFGMFASSKPGLMALMLLAFTAIAIGVVVWLWIQNRAKGGIFGYALAFIFAGATGNLIDRIRLGEVIDFVDVYWGRSHWPAFNVADSAITVGVGILLIHLLFQKEEKEEDARENSRKKA